MRSGQASGPRRRRDRRRLRDHRLKDELAGFVESAPDLIVEPVRLPVERVEGAEDVDLRIAILDLEDRGVGVGLHARRGRCGGKRGSHSQSHHPSPSLKAGPGAWMTTRERVAAHDVRAMKCARISLIRASNPPARYPMSMVTKTLRNV